MSSLAVKVVEQIASIHTDGPQLCLSAHKSQVCTSPRGDLDRKSTTSHNAKFINNAWSSCTGIGKRVMAVCTHTQTHTQTQSFSHNVPFARVTLPVSCCQFPVEPISGEHWNTNYGLKQCSIGCREKEKCEEGSWEWLGGTKGGNGQWWYRRKESDP